MKFARYVPFIVLSLVYFSQTVFASDFSDKVISNTNTEITEEKENNKKRNWYIKY